jgi:hypothetical protein
MNRDRPAFIILSREEIAARAYERYVERGRVDGSAEDDWLRAEQELRILGQKTART